MYQGKFREDEKFVNYHKSFPSCSFYTVACKFAKLTCHIVVDTPNDLCYPYDAIC